MKKTVSQLVDSQRFVASGVFGSNIEKYSLKERDFKGQRFVDVSNLDRFYEILSISKPEIISEIYERLLKAGSDIVLTNTIFANRAFLAEKGLEDITYELNLSAAKLARDKVTKYTNLTREKPRYVAGCLSELGNFDFEIKESYYSEQIKALYAGKVDFLVLKNISSKESIIAALSAIDKLMKRRNKTAEFVLSINNFELFKEICKENIVENFENLKLVATGFRLNIEQGFEDEYEKMASHFFGRKMISIYRDINSDVKDEDILKFAEKLAKDENLRLVMLLENFSPDFFAEFLRVFK
jgi:methionine synthase I (cobalamin-dependent)